MIIRNWSLMVLAFVLCAAPAMAQKWEVGAGGGASFYTSKTVSGPDGQVNAKFKPGAGFTAYMGQIGDRVGGEVRYTMMFNSMELSGGSASTSMSGRSQSIGYNLLIYTNGKDSKTRGYVLAGGGIKQYTGTGNYTGLPPFIRTAVLTNTSEWKPMVTTGVGVRVKAGENSHFRAELLVQGTETPTQVITPVMGSLGGWYFSFAPMFSLSYVW
ncbi:MAG: outer membrane beta-barrel protein [Bryobacteraceae bacterium]|nr:outer membrane beta-barrel protein [Bryobacteraceae bacterium]